MCGRYRTGHEDIKGPTMLERVQASKMQPNAISIEVQINQKKYWGFLNPLVNKIQPGFPESFELYFWGEYCGTITYYPEGWVCSKELDRAVIDAVGDYLIAWYG
jgi:hypothetical protein